MGTITCKFGGSSLADGQRIRAAADIVRADARRRYIVPSAPGKRDDGDKKITDLFYAWYHSIRDGMDPSEPMALIRERFSTLAVELGLDIDIDGELKTIARNAEKLETPDYLASRGEYLNAVLFARCLNATVVDASDCIKFDNEGGVDPISYELIAKAVAGDGLFVIPGFYGADPQGQVRTFTRGGSDVSGAIVARATRSEVYENWTDVSGIRVTDPRIVPEAERIEEITYTEVRELAYMGASVVHDEAIFPLRDLEIPIHIRNAQDPDSPGTMVVARRESSGPICGIAAREGFTMITIEKAMMNREVGFARKALSVLEDLRISFEHMPSGIDTISLIVKNEELAHNDKAITRGIDRICEPDSITLSPGLALIATVGQGMNHEIGVAGRLCMALADARVNLRVIDQGSSEMNIIVGVEEKDLRTAVRAIYNEFKR